MLDLDFTTRDEWTYREWKKGEREFHIYLDRDLRDCVVYAWLMGFCDQGYDAGMFELGPMEIVAWEWGAALGAPGPWNAASESVV